VLSSHPDGVFQGNLGRKVGLGQDGWGGQKEEKGRQDQPE
jgi:hypothetical protein